MVQRRKLHIDIPPEASFILEVLHSHGYEAYVVGGCVRDALLGRVPGDWDITTSALPAEVKALFPHTADTGIRHGTVMVLKNGSGYEVTTYRIDGAYEDGRHPKSVTFTRSLGEDLKRRDFTINAFAWGEEGLIDLFEGLKDLDDGTIRCVGDPDQRFDEDALRIMRAVRFSAQLGFRIEKYTGEMIRRHAPRLRDISMERIRTEWEKTLLSDHPEYVNLYADYGIAPFIIHQGYERCFRRERDPLLKELFRRRGNVLSEERCRILMISAFMLGLTPQEADTALRGLKYDNRTREAVGKVLRYRTVSLQRDRLYLKQMLNLMGEELFLLVLALKDAEYAVQLYPEGQTADSRVTLQESGGQAAPSEIFSLTQEILSSGEPYCIAQLAVNGTDLIRAGIPAGKKIGEILEKILQKVMQSPTLNTKELLCEEQFLREVEHECERGV